VNNNVIELNEANFEQEVLGDVGIPGSHYRGHLGQPGEGRRRRRGHLAALEGQPADALALYREALNGWRDLGLVAFEFQDYSTVADRYMYVPMLGASMIWIGLIEGLGRRHLQKVIMLSVLVGLAVIFQLRTLQDYSTVWKNQLDFFWQLSWRAPMLKADTALLSQLVEGAGLLFLRSSRPELVALQQARQRRVTDPSLRAESLLRIARIEEEKLGDQKAATRSLQEAVQVEPENLRALRELARLLEEQGDFRSLAAVLGRQAALSNDNERAVALLRLGKVYERELGEHKEATQAYLQALEIDNIASGAVEGLERLFAAKALRNEDIAAVAGRLAPYYELTENYAKWAGTLESLVRVAKDEAERKGHLEMLADLYAGPLGDAPAAYSAMQRIFEIDPASHAVRERLVQLAELVGKLPEIAESARQVLAVATEPTLREELLMLVADVEERQPGRLGEAEAALRGVLEIDPLHLGAYRTLCRICKDAERWSALRELIAVREAHIPDVKQRVELLWQVVEIDDGLLNDRANAAATLGRIIELSRDDLKAYRILERHHTEAQRWRELDNLLQTEMTMVPRGDIADIKARRAELALNHFDDAAGALNFIAEVLDLSPAHAQAIPLLELALIVPAERHRAAAMLDALYTASGNWARLIDILDIETEVLEGPEAISLLMRKAELQEDKLDEPAQALDTWRTVLDLDAHAERALAEAERLGSSLGRHGDLIAMYQAMAEKRDRSDVAGIADLLTRAARLCTAHVPDRKVAVAAWRRVLDLDPRNADTGAKAAEALELLGHLAALAQSGHFEDRGGSVLRAQGGSVSRAHFQHSSSAASR